MPTKRKTRTPKKPRPLEPDWHMYAVDESSVLDSTPQRHTKIIAFGYYAQNPTNGSHGTWKVGAGKTKATRKKTMHALAAHDIEPLLRWLSGWPTHVRMVRMGPGTLDVGNLHSTLKPVQDQIAAWLAGDNTPTGKGDDSPRSGIVWLFEQQCQKPHGIRIEVTRETFPLPGGVRATERSFESPAAKKKRYEREYRAGCIGSLPGERHWLRYGWRSNVGSTADGQA